MRRPPSSSLAAASTVARHLLHAQGGSRWRRHPPRAEQLAEAGFAAQLAAPASSTRSAGRGRLHQRATAGQAPDLGLERRAALSGHGAGAPRLTVAAGRGRGGAVGDGRRTGGGGASAPCPNEAADGWGLRIGPCLGVGDGRRTDGWGSGWFGWVEPVRVGVRGNLVILKFFSLLPLKNDYYNG